MKIALVISSNLPIGKTGERRYGAVELIMEEYRKKLEFLGHEVHFRWLNDVRNEDYDIVHIHVANLCIEARKKGIQYIYSNHDHHSAYYGKGSSNYNEQLEAIKGSIFSIAHAESVVNFFDETDKLFYLEHGVDTEYFKPSFSDKEGILMCANNGLAGNYSIDRKGFRLGIESARKLDLPITIIGGEANDKFFEIHSDLLNYHKLLILSQNMSEQEKLGYFQKAKVFVHPSMLEFGSPNITLLESASVCLPMVAAYDGSMKIDGLLRLNALDSDEISDKIQYAILNSDNLVKKMNEVRDKYDWIHVVRKLQKYYTFSLKNKERYDSISCQEIYKSIYND